MVAEDKTKKELIGNEGLVILDMVRRLTRRNASGHLKKLIKKTHPADLAWVFRYLAENERKNVFAIIAQTEIVGEFLSELDDSIMIDLVQGLSAQYMAEVVTNMASDDAAICLRRCQPRLQTIFVGIWKKRIGRRWRSCSSITPNPPADSCQRTI